MDDTLPYVSIRMKDDFIWKEETAGIGNYRSSIRALKGLNSTPLKTDNKYDCIKIRGLCA